MMQLIPTWPIAVGTLVVGLGVGGIGAQWWNSDTIADLELKISQAERDKATEVASQYKTTLEDFVAASDKIKTASEASQTSYIDLSQKLDAIDRRYKNAKPPAPLPVDCKPGSERLQRLAESAAAVNSAIARPASGK